MKITDPAAIAPIVQGTAGKDPKPSPEAMRAAR
jgi:hypothetical protein